MQNITHTFFINLDRCTANRDRIMDMLAAYGIPAVERFPATANGYGYIGATISHLQALKQAKQRGYRNVLILEDDFEFLVAREELESMLDTFFATPELADTYDVLMLSHYVNRREATPVSGIERALDAQAFAGYLVSERYYDELIRVIEGGLTKLVETHEHWNYMVDQIVKQSQPHTRWYFFSRRVGKQTDREF
jgi:GR25 family glycosyltransferase involved in LPS biosynthesis